MYEMQLSRVCLFLWRVLQKNSQKNGIPPCNIIEYIFFLSPLDVHLRPLAPVSSASLVCDSALKGAVTWLFSDMTTN